MKIRRKTNRISLIILSGFIALSFLLYLIALRIHDKNNSLLFLLISCTGIVVVMLGILNMHLSRNIIKPLRDIQHGSSKALAEKDPNVQLNIKTGDELEEISENFNKMTSALCKIDMLESTSERGHDVIRALSMLTEMMGFITSELKFETILQRFLEMLRSLLRAEHSAIFIFEENWEKIKLIKTTAEQMGEASIKCAQAMLQGPLGDSIKTLTPLRINEFSQELPVKHISIRNLIALPLTSAEDRMSALIVLVNKNDGFTEEDENTLLNFAFQAFQALTIHEEIARHALTDGLTGLNNHRTFQERLSEEIQRAERYSKSFSLIMLDIDYFKSFNDTYGHQTGDKVLKDIAKIIKASIRNVDFPARYGGEEFVILLPEMSCEDAGIVAERIRKRVNEHPFSIDGREHITLTISAGIACYPVTSNSKETLIKKADEALYFAKNHGRNMVCTYEDTIRDFVRELPEKLENILKDSSLKKVEDIAREVDEKSTYTKGHSLEVAAYAVKLGKHIRLDNAQIESLRLASILHDLGNIAIPEHILNKPSPLTAEEKSIIQGHPGLAEMVLKKYPHTEDTLPAILYHHERFDGKGYPLGLKAEEIPLPARILAVVEAYHAMISPRPYRRRLTKEEASEELRKGSGSQFDPMVANAFIKLLQEESSEENPL